VIAVGIVLADERVKGVEESLGCASDIDSVLSSRQACKQAGVGGIIEQPVGVTLGGLVHRSVPEHVFWFDSHRVLNRLAQADQPWKRAPSPLDDPAAVAQSLRSAGVDVEDGTEDPTLTDPNGQQLVLVSA
jgi:hypothetical protein